MAKRLVDKEIAKFDSQDKVRTTIEDGDGQSMSFNSRGHQEVEIASQVSPPFLGHFYNLNNGFTTITAEAVVGANTITVASAAGAAIGESVVISDTTNARFYIGHVVGVAGLVITVDTPIDFPYASGSDATFASHDMNVNGAVTPVLFGIREAENPANLQTTIELDITRVLCAMITTSLGDLDDFGDIVGGLTNGVVLRKKYDDGTFGNIVNIKTNADYALFAYDFDRYIASNPGIGINGQKWRLTFGGEEKMGTVIRVGPGEDLQWVVQDDLTSLTSFINVAEGAQVAD
jgi:hypothetical protein